MRSYVSQSHNDTKPYTHRNLLSTKDWSTCQFICVWKPSPVYSGGKWIAVPSNEVSISSGFEFQIFPKASVTFAFCLTSQTYFA